MAIFCVFALIQRVISSTEHHFSPISRFVVGTDRQTGLIGSFDKSEARVFGSVVQAIFKDGRANHKSGNVRLRLCASGPLMKESVIKLGAYGRAYDRPEERRAYTYEHQPGNIEAHKLGRACSDVHSGGDWIDRGLNLLNALQREGFGVFELPAAPAKLDGETYEERLLDRRRFESGSLTEARWTVPALAASKPAGDARFEENAPAKQEGGDVTSK